MIKNDTEIMYRFMKSENFSFNVYNEKLNSLDEHIRLINCTYAFTEFQKELVGLQSLKERVTGNNDSTLKYLNAQIKFCKTRIDYLKTAMKKCLDLPVAKD